MMKKSSKIICIVLALTMAMSCFAGLSIFSASATEGETKIYFELPEELWGEVAVHPKKDPNDPNEIEKITNVYCHIYSVYNDPDFEGFGWQTKKERCVYDKETKLYSMDVEAVYGGLKDGADYAVLFSTDKVSGLGHQTGNITLSKECYGDTVYCTGNTSENTENSNITDWEGAWRSPENAAKYGAKASITSTGTIVGTYFPVYMPHETIITEFLHTWAVTNASYISPEVVQADCEYLNVDPIVVYNDYATRYADELANPEEFPGTASLETIATLLGVTPEPLTSEPTTTETEPQPTETEPQPTETEPAVLYGDVNGDGRISVLDATDIQKSLVSLITFDSEQTKLADVDGNGRVSVLDATMIQKYLVQLGDTGLVGKPVE